MAKNPAELETLLWAVAESRDPKAMEEFIRRYPALRSDLMRRAAMIERLKAQGAAISHEAPPFSPRPNIHWGWPKPVKGAVIGVALVAASTLSYWVASKGMQGAAPKPELQKSYPESAPDGGGGFGGDSGGGSDSNDGDAPATRGHYKDRDLDDRPPRKIGVQAQTPVPTTPHFSIHLSNVPLMTTFSAIQAQAGVTFEMPPNMPNPSVTINYEEASVDEILKDMGRRYGFTAFNEGEGKYLIIPATEQRTPGRTSPMDSGQNPTELNH